jgi:DNA-directed RNA polymerase omega subunit
MVTTTIEAAKGRAAHEFNGHEGWPGIVSRFQLVILAGRRSKQLLRGAQPRIPVDPLRRRNTSIALEELRRGLVPFSSSETQIVPASIDSIVHVTDLDLSKVE